MRILFVTFSQLRNDRYTYVVFRWIVRQTRARTLNTNKYIFSNAIERCIQISTMSADIGRAGWLNYDSSRYSIIYYSVQRTFAAPFFISAGQERQIKNSRHRSIFSMHSTEIFSNKKFDDKGKLQII